MKRPAVRTVHLLLGPFLAVNPVLLLVLLVLLLVLPFAAIGPAYWALAASPARAKTEAKAQAQSATLDSKPMNSDQRVVQVLNRLTFGAKPGDFDRVKAMGVKAYVSSQLNPRSIAENPAVDVQVASAEIIHRKSADLIKEFRLKLAQKNAASKAAGNKGVGFNEQSGQSEKDAAAAKQEQMQKLKEIKVIADQVYKTRLVRALDSERQLQEVMVDFWYNHFNVSINKGLDHVLIGAYEEQAIRPNALGRFRDILGATCYHPAMLFYLDNWQNAAPGSPMGYPPGSAASLNNPNGVNGRAMKKGGLNENYARELMELHTLGVDGGYTQKDVNELARVLTGLSLPSRGYWGQFYPGRHDQGEKVVLGHKITARGAGEIEEALDLLARHPSTAHHISFALAQYFVADKPPKALVDRMAKRFSESNGDIKAVLTTLFESSEFFDTQYQNNKYKSPLRYAVSSLRASGGRPPRYEPIYSFLKLQGQPLYGCLTPDGYKNTKEAWLNSDALLKRISFATALGAAANVQAYDQVLRTVNGGSLSDSTSAVIAKSAEPYKTALLLGSPEFMTY
ncbi:MAG: DUF1800 domain-containing protein [Candidatus Melainabacteria bacterium]|nr:DUF1800 domain-containing protein [Candidatus Melainabacteria bacterium]